MARQPSTDLEEYSSSSTLIPFDRPIHLLRGPIPAGQPDDPSSGRFILAFRDPRSWASAYRACKVQITQQCETGARIGCSIAASNKCKSPWWKTLLGVAKQDLKEREICEEREMAACVENSKEKCQEFAKEKCLPSFKDARIAWDSSRVNWKEVYRLIKWVSLPEKSAGFELLGVEGNWVEFKRMIDSTNYRGSELLDSNYMGSEDFAVGSNQKN
ncbi:unnamed protein product [Ilex paraguariensis]|uniref:Uncharacterized protein n=1 Tax=Ilex paraguariensis TaxID=185542 RepID=A0ABC8TW69_9AQUA